MAFFFKERDEILLESHSGPLQRFRPLHPVSAICEMDVEVLFIRSEEEGLVCTVAAWFRYDQCL